MINTVSCNPTEAISALKGLWELPMAAMLWGPPGVGKSAIVRQLAEEMGVPLKDVRLSHKVASDIGGLPALDHDAKKTTFYRPDFLPDVERDGPEGILFLDELPGADDQTRIASYGLILERTVADYKLPDGWRIIAAGNRPEDDPVNREFGTAMNDRLVHFVVEPDHNSWINWAVRHNIATEVVTFIKIFPHRLSADKVMLDEQHSITPSPRSWERVSHVVKTVPNRRTRELIISGLIGDLTASEFTGIADELAGMTSVQELLEMPMDKVPQYIPTSLNGLYALTFALASNFNRTTGSKILHIIGVLGEMHNGVYARLPMSEVQLTAFSMVVERALESRPRLDLTEHPVYIKINQQRIAEERALQEIAA